MEKETRKMQSVSFRRIGELLAFLPEDQLAILEQLRGLVCNCLPDIKERLSFNVPFYSHHKNICHIWPGAVPWGSKTWPGVEFGFSYGNLLTDPFHYLERGTRKQVFSKRFFSENEIKEDILRSYLLEAWELDEMMFQEKTR